MRVTVRVHPGASREALVAREDGVLEAWLRSPPVEGRANRALLELLAERLRVPRTALRLARGASGRTKTVELPLDGWSEVIRRLSER